MWTWRSPDGRAKNEIDFILTNKASFFSNFDVISRLNFNTNHRLIRAKLKTLEPRKHRPEIKPGKIKLGKHQVEELQRTLKEKFNNFKSETIDLNIQGKYNYYERTITEQLQLTANNRITQKKWVSTDTIKLLEQRNNLICSRNISDRRKLITKISKEIKESMRKDRKRNRLEIIEKYILKTGGIKKAYKELENSKDWIVKMKNNSRKQCHDRSEILSIATDYYKMLYGCENSTLEDSNIMTTDNCNNLSGPSPPALNVPNILQVEVENAIDSLKKDKAPGPDGIDNDILKHNKETIIPILTELFNDILVTEIIPQQWTESNIILLHKKGDKHDIGNYRPISLMSNTYKIFAKILLNRMERTLDEQQTIEQAGFRKGYSVLDHIHVVRQILEKFTQLVDTVTMACIGSTLYSRKALGAGGACTRPAV
ncbi:uncharacterized protein LOC121736750 [Aricia agestis]|uniref:uncharacterized protein LOC121736750 n=1 Tax=Aricia agestis TaxID=91739 RepID=UPI001C20AC5E|nr:uncharacterized protein LOC121736750 [Aricia agestis]